MSIRATRRVVAVPVVVWYPDDRDGPAAPGDGEGTREAIVTVKEGVNFYFFIK